MSAAWALQTAMFGALTADAGVVSALGGARVWDEPPQRAEFPYLTFAQSVARDWSTGSDNGGQEHTVTLHVWARGSSRKQTFTIIEAVRDALHDASLSLTGHRLINLRHETSDVRRDANGENLHGIVRFRAVTEQVS